ncbi:1-acyl-sn-glycerol-3-phosphate acyltransferase [Acanthopleuribacter pedis]|uniref:1-acyl-sn-glycerol-3-phosphate acyltransferase n=1 Tax=Acanthopleuribacter pedis TaxID=442870 RepID=A0A8J7QLQ8_9BACT|nr:1-acyl-sn-glycerol-3-phosphate acyltransferase [Acanthopleuribacter pedis]MBO1320633.1 1-acyl-sn-glycerol-3-phosphate acyltransferase [Acanthopleuribacter pedis]
MQAKKSDQSATWLFFSTFLGINAGLFAIHINSQPTQEPPFQPFDGLLLPGLVTALVLPLVGMLTDNAVPRRHLSFGLGLALLAYTSLLIAMDPILPLSFLCGLFAVLFLLTAWSHQALISAFPIEKKLDRPGKSLVVMGFSMVFTVTPTLIIQMEPNLWALYIIVASAPAWTCLVFYWKVAPEPTRVDNNTLSMPPSVAFTAWLQIPFKDLRRSLTTTFLATAAATLLLRQILEPIFVAIAADTAPTLMTPALLVLAAIWGCYSTPRLNRHFGSKRNGAFSLWLMILLQVGHLISTQTFLESLILAVLTVIVCANLFVVLLGQIGRFSPVAYAGQSLGFFYAASYAAMVIGLAFPDAYGSPSLHWLFLAAAVAALVFGQGVNPKRGVTLAFGKEVEQEDPDQDWVRWDEEPTGLARHHFVSRLVQLLARTIAEIFFAKVRLVGTENLKTTGPAILVANHPNTFLDPLLITALSPGRLHYWAKSTLWRAPIFGSILDRLGAIPVYRRQDYGENQANQNNLTLEIAADRLCAGAWILIFPEGVSMPGLNLKPLKTGAARLGFLTLEREQWAADLPIIPIGIDYMEPEIFRSNVTIRIGEPVRLEDYRETYEANQREAVKETTQALSHRMMDLIPHLEAPELAALVDGIHDLYGDKVLQVLETDDDTEARKIIADAVNHYQELDPDTVYLFQKRLEAYHTERKRLATPENHAPIPFSELFQILLNLFSFTSFGLVSNWFPYKATGRFIEWFEPGPGWTATAKLAVGTSLFVIYYTAVAGAVVALTGKPFLAALLIAAMILSAFTALGAMDRFAFQFKRFKALWQAFWTQNTNDELAEMQLVLIQDLERFREAYAFYHETEESP